MGDLITFLYWKCSNDSYSRHCQAKRKQGEKAGSGAGVKRKIKYRKNVINAAVNLPHFYTKQMEE